MNKHNQKYFIDKFLNKIYICTALYFRFDDDQYEDRKVVNLINENLN